MDTTDETCLNNSDLFIKEEPIYDPGTLAAKIAFYNFEWRFTTLVLFNTVHVIALQTFLKNYNMSVVVKLGRFVPTRRAAVSQFVIFGEEPAEISGTIRWLAKMKYDNNAKFIIICASRFKDCDLEKIFESLHKFFVLNVIVLKISVLTHEPEAYSYRIVSPGKCYIGEPYSVNMISDCHNDKCFMGLYPEKLSNFYKCPLVISTIEQPPFMYLHNGTKKPSGTDAELLKLAADMLNGTLVLKPPTDGTDGGHYSYIHKNWTGSLGDIFNGLAQAAACAAPLSANKYGNFQISFTYYSMDMVWAAKLPAETAPWEKLLFPLKFPVRIVLLFTFIGIILMNTLKDSNMWRKVRRTFWMEPLKYNLLFYSWLLFLGMPVLKIPTKRFLRIVLFTWIWYCFIVRSAYQAGLINSLKHPAYLEDMTSFREVLQDKYPYGGLGNLRDFYSDDRDIYSNWIRIDMEDIYEILDDILDGTTDFVLAANKDIIKYHLMKYNGVKKLQIIPEKIVNSPTVVYFRKYSPLTAPLSYILRVAHEAGFVELFYARYVDRGTNLLKRLGTQKRERLSLYHFSGCFAVLIVGWLVSSIYFAVEYICGNLNEK